MNEYLSKENLQYILNLVKDCSGHNFDDYKEATLQRRIQRKISFLHIEEPQAYIELLENSAEELQSLCNELLIHVTEFFRDQSAFTSLYQNVFPKMKIEKNEIRFWCVACATGEEVYSIAILIEEYLKNHHLSYTYKIFATDIDEDCINTASKGTYSLDSLKEMPTILLETYFNRTHSYYQVKDELREHIVFAKHNILKDIPFSQLNLIVCRNLFIYIKPEMQKKLLSMFHRLLRSNGFLLLGNGEGIQDKDLSFLCIDKTNKVFQCNPAYHPSEREDPIFPSVALKSTLANMVPTRSKLKEDMGWQILNHVLPPSVLIDAFGRIIYVINHVEPYLRLRTGRYEDTLLTKVPMEISLSISSIIKRLENSESSSVSETISGIAEYQNKPIIIGGQRLSLEQGIYYLVQFREKKERFTDAPVSFSETDISQKRIQELKEALAASNLALKRAMRELEISNEELKSSYEEIIASNEEFQSSNEELQSVNEELCIVNEEFQKKINELTQMSTDLDNLLLNGEIGALYIDSSMKIRKITPIMEDISNILHTDVGRPITQVHFMENYPDFLQDLNEVMAHPKILERTIVSDEKGTWLVKIRPYQSALEESDGILVTLFNITKRMEAAQMELRQLINNVPGGVFELRIDINQKKIEPLYISDGFYNVLSLPKPTAPPSSAIVDQFLKLIDPQDSINIKNVFRKLARDRQGSAFFEARILKRNGEKAWILIEGSVSPLENAIIFYGYITDCTQRKLVEQQLRVNEQRYRYAIKLTHTCIWEYEFSSKNIYQSDNSLGRYTLYGDTLKNVPESLIESQVIHPDFADTFLALHYDNMFKGEPVSSWIGKVKREDQSYAWTKITYMTILDDAGKPLRAIGVSEDLDATYNAEMLYQQESQYRIGIASEALAAYSINVTTNTITNRRIAKNNLDLLHELQLDDDCSYDEFVKKWAETRVVNVDQQKYIETRSSQAIKKAYQNGARELQVEYQIRGFAPHPIWVSNTVILIDSSDNENLFGFVYVKDIDKKKKEELKLRHLAEIDVLTGLYNRATIEDKVNQHLMGKNAKPCAMALVDIDNFKGINDHFGHDYGDEVLRIVGQRLLNLCTKNELLGRLGGDEFLILLKEVSSREQVVQKAEEFCNALTRIFTGALKKYHTSGSVGITLALPSDTEFRSLYRKADKALYEAKNQGKNRYYFYDDLQNKRSVEEYETDRLTGIGSRASFESKAYQLLQNNPSKSYAITCTDVNHFKFINDLYGMEEGDRTLQIIADALQEATRENGLCARITGDIFCVCTEYKCEGDLIHLTEQITQLVKNHALPYKVDLYFGFCKVTDLSAPINILCDWANMAIKTIKGNAMQKWAFYDEVLRAKQLNERNIENEMENALEREEFLVYLQPKHDIRTGKIVGAEALTRWMHPQKGLLQPREYISLFEQNGFIFHLDEYVYTKVCAFIQYWLGKGYPPLPISVNLSRTYMFNPQLLPSITRIQKQYRIPANLIEFELTEGAFVNNTTALYQIMADIKSLGVHFSMDDFGSGYSNLNMLKNAPIDIVKLDRGFFSDAIATVKGEVIVRHVISMAHELNMEVIAEGVETAEQAAFLLEVGCTTLQGFLYSKPQPLLEFEKFFEKGQQ